MADLAASESTPVAHEGGLTASTGYKFAGWANTPTGPVAYPGGSTIGITANKTIYAKFAPISYQVAFDGNGADGGTVIGNQAFVYDTAQDLTRNQWTRTGYTFGGWTEDVNGTGRVYADQENVTNLSATDGDVVTLHAKWVPNDYTVAFDDNGSDGGTAIGPQAFVYDTAQDLTKNQWTRTGYTFGGWTRDVDGTVTTYADQENVKNLSDVDGDTVTLQAAWAPIGYQVAFGRNGADGGSMGNQLFVYDVAQPLTANALTRTGYDFTGWNTAADGSGTAYADQQDVNNLTDADGSVVTLYAQWSAHHYSVSFGGNGGARSMPGQAFTYGTPQALAANTYTRSGFSFVGWNTAANGSGTSYADQAVVNNLTPVDGATVTLYAQWETLPDTSGGSEKPPHLPSTGGPQLWLLVVALLLLGFGLVALVATRRRR